MFTYKDFEYLRPLLSWELILKDTGLNVETIKRRRYGKRKKDLQQEEAIIIVKTLKSIGIEYTPLDERL